MIAAFLVVAGVAVAVVLAMNNSDVSDWFDLNASNESYVGKTEDQIRADLNAKVEEGMMNQ